MHMRECMHMYYHTFTNIRTYNRAKTVDTDTIDALNSELAIAEDVTVCTCINIIEVH
jgi:sortase (surface protein transpeptidase)